MLVTGLKKQNQLFKNQDHCNSYAQLIASQFHKETGNVLIRTFLNQTYTGHRTVHHKWVCTCRRTGSNPHNTPLYPVNNWHGSPHTYLSCHHSPAVHYYPLWGTGCCPDSGGCHTGSGMLARGSLS